MLMSGTILFVPIGEVSFDDAFAVPAQGGGNDFPRPTMQASEASLGADSHWKQQNANHDNGEPNRDPPRGRQRGAELFELFIHESQRVAALIVRFRDGA